MSQADSRQWQQYDERHTCTCHTMIIAVDDRPFREVTVRDPCCRFHFGKPHPMPCGCGMSDEEHMAAALGQRLDAMGP